jgi:hypothetical protein
VIIEYDVVQGLTYMVAYLAIGPRAPGCLARSRSGSKGCTPGLQLHAVHARPAQSPRKQRILIGTAVDPLKPFIHGLVMSRRRNQIPRCGSSTPYELQEIGMELAVTANSFTGRADDDGMKGLADVSTFFR